MKDKTEKENQFFRKAILLEKRVTVPLYRLATSNSYRSKSKVFGIDLESVAKIAQEFCEAILKEARQFIKILANGRETSPKVEEFSYFGQKALP